MTPETLILAGPGHCQWRCWRHRSAGCQVHCSSLISGQLLTSWRVNFVAISLSKGTSASTPQTEAVARGLPVPA
jgi:hypothetical protein